MNRLVIHKQVTERTLFRILGGSTYKNHYWHIADSKNEVVAYLTQFKPDIISIGPLEGMTSTEVALYLRALYQTIGQKLPSVIAAHKEDKQQIQDALRSKDPR